MLTILLAIMTFGSIYASDQIYKKVIGSSIFVLKEMSIYGNSIISASDIQKSTGLNIGMDGVLSSMPQIIESRIKAQSLYVESVGVKRDLMSGQLIIKVKEREPVAIIAESKNATTFDVVDINGFVIEQLTKDGLLSYSDNGMIFIFGGSAKGFARQNINSVSDKITDLYKGSESANLALNVLSGIRSIIPSIYNEISYIDARDSNDIKIFMKNGLNIRVAGDRIKEGLVDVSNWMTNPKIQDMETDLNYIDARFPGAIYCG
ncbi:MAG: FtsQ-type POTRA domain-containing protein [Candidatus Poribacteria bacterium]